MHFNPIIAADETTSLAELLGAFSYALDPTDFFDALTADRPYRAAMPAEKALAIMEGEAGRAIDPDCGGTSRGRRIKNGTPKRPVSPPP